MPREKLPGFVPWPEAGSYTDRIEVGEFGFPIGFDEERLQLNLHGLARTMTMAGLNRLTVSGYSGEKSENVLGIGGIGRDGSASATKIGLKTKAKVYDMDLEDTASRLPIEYQWRKAEIRINTSEIDNQITNESDKWPRRQFDPHAQAKYLNRALQRSLSEAATDSYMPHPKFNVAAWAGMAAVQEAMYTAIDFGSPGFNLAYAIAGYLPANGLLHLLSKIQYRGVELPPRKWSINYHIAFDRMFAAKALARTTRFIRAV